MVQCQSPRIETPEERRKNLRVIRAILLFFIACTLAMGAVGTNWAVGAAANSSEFAAAPQCPAGTAPTGDCVAWVQETVTSVSSGPRTGIDVSLSGGRSLKGQELKYDSHGPAWISGLSSGASVSVLVWEGSAQALRQPGGGAVYSPDSVPLAGFGDTGVAIMGFSLAIGLSAGLLALSPLARRRPRPTRVLSYLIADIGPSGMVAGFVLSFGHSTHTALVVWPIVYCVIAALILVTLRIVRSVQGRKAQRPVLAAGK